MTGGAGKGVRVESTGAFVHQMAKRPPRILVTERAKPLNKIFTSPFAAHGEPQSPALEADVFSSLHTD